jgi:hypothetical protein
MSSFQNVDQYKSSNDRKIEEDQSIKYYTNYQGAIAMSMSMSISISITQRHNKKSLEEHPRRTREPRWY